MIANDTVVDKEFMNRPKSKYVDDLAHCDKGISENSGLPSFFYYTNFL